MISNLRNIEIQQYNKFETMFISQRREDIVDSLQNIPKDRVVAILDSYDEMVHEVAPDIISVKDCIKTAIENGMIEPNLYDINNKYREMAAAVIDTVENQLYDILPDPEEDEEVPENVALSKICGETYYELEDALTDLFKDTKF
jgi:hypothetical protein